jgi:hypothetical protein
MTSPRRHLRCNPRAASASIQVTTIIVIVASTLFGSVGWWVGSLVGVMTAFVLSVVGTAVGVYLGRRVAREWW